MTAEGINIRPARTDDADAAAALWAQMAEQHRAYDEAFFCWAEDAVARWRGMFDEQHAAEDMVVLVAEDVSAGVVGFAVAAVRESPPIYATKRRGELWDLVVDAAHQRRGVGRRLMETVLAELTRRGCEKLVLHAALDNPAAAAFYEQFGLRKVMVRMYRRL